MLGTEGAIVTAALTSGEPVLSGLLFTGPVIASVRLTPRLTAATGAVALSCALLVALVLTANQTDEITRLAIAGIGSSLAVWIAVLRSSREAAGRRLAAQHAVARVGAESRTLAEAAPKMLRAISETLDWDLGALWEVDEGAGLLRHVATWSAEPEDLEAFERLSSETTFEPGAGLPGRVWQSGRPAWIVDVTDDPNFPRAPGALAAGLCSAFAFPLGAHDRVVGAMEFFVRDRREPDSDLLRMMETFGTQVGTYVEVKRAEQRVHDSEALKTGILDAALDSVITIDSGGQVIEFNPAAEKTFGYSREAVIGQEMGKLIVPEDLLEAHRAGLRRYDETQPSAILDQRLELQARRSDGAHFPVEVAIRRIPGTRPPLFTGYLRDITERVRAAEELRRSRDELEVILGHLADGVTVQDPAGRIVYANAAAARLIGLESPDDLIDDSSDKLIERFAPTYPNGRPIDRSRLPGSRALRGETPEDLVLRYRHPTSGEERWALVKASPVRDPGGDVVLAVNVFEDITAHRRRESAQHFLAEASRVLGASLDYEATLQSVAELAVREICDWCAVDIVAPDGTLERVTLVHGDPAMLRRAEELRKRYPPREDAPSGAPRVTRTGEPELHMEIAEETLDAAAEDEEHLRLLREFGLASAIVVPIPGLDRALGAITLVSAESRRRYDEDDLSLALELGRRAATAIENARVFSARAHIAQTLQRSLLPPLLPEIPGLQLAARYRAAGEGGDVGGDFYDAFQLSNGCWAIAIGDVCGKGAEAAAVTALARYTLRALAMHETSPARILEQLNTALMRQRNDRQFCTVVYAHVDLTTPVPELEIASAGHPPPLLVHADGKVEPAAKSGTLLGVVDDPAIAVSTIRLQPGRTLVLYTDGVTDARVGDAMLGIEGLVEAASRLGGCDATEVAERIEQAASGGGTEALRDDVAVLVLSASPGSLNGGGPASVVADRGLEIDLRLPATEAAVARARQALEPLERALGGRIFEDLRLLVSELVTNGLRHAGARAEDWIGVSVARRGTALRVEVSDPGPGFGQSATPLASGAGDGRPRKEADGPAVTDREGGWGLVLVDQLAARWGVDTGERTTVWLEIDEPAA